jgi:type I restriction enzyme M protein
MYRKLRKNLGNKNCELAPGHITDIVKNYTELAAVERTTEDSIASKVFDNADFGYYKVTIERPKRLKAQFTAKRIADLRFDKGLKDVMQQVYAKYGEKVYEDLRANKKEILDWAEKEGFELNKKQEETLLKKETWTKQLAILEIAALLLNKLGDQEYTDFNIFKDKVDDVLKAEKIKLSATEKNQILNAVSWYDETVEKVIKATVKLSGEKLDQLLYQFDCTVEDLPNYGYYPTAKKGEFVTYETDSDLRDTENVPLKENIYEYFLQEVQPHVAEAWINLEATKIGYEISFNKYFYQHKALRSLEEVTADILALEKQSDGLIHEILNF